MSAPEPTSLDSGSALFVEGPIKCARCGGEHTDLVYMPFRVPLSRKGVVTHTHWTVCPTTGEPSCAIEPRDGVVGPPDSFGLGYLVPLEEVRKHLQGETDDATGTEEP